MSLVPSSITTKVTKATLVSLLLTVGSIMGYVALGPKYTLLGGLIGYAIGDVVTFLQSNTLSNNWQYASKTVLIIAVLTAVGTFAGQLVGAGVIGTNAGALIGYVIGEAINLLETGGNPTTTPTLPTQ